MKAAENTYSHLTAKERSQLSFPSKYLKNQGLLSGRVLDYGCGFGKDVEVLDKQGLNITGYDPNYFPDWPSGKFNTIICHYVLNVLKPEEQATVLMRVSSLLAENGKAYFAVRRDIAYEGFRMHKVHKKPTFQMLVKLPYESVFQNESCEIYRYQRIVDQPPGECVFCVPAAAVFLCESATAYAILDKFPVVPGHALIIPKRHQPDYFSLTEREQRACWIMVNEVKTMLEREYSCSDFNIGINVGKTAGQTVPHAHIHLIPRKKGDVKNPVGGIRNVIEGMGDYTERK